MPGRLVEKVYKLNNGTSMPAHGLGTWRCSPEEAQASVYNAIKNNYRLIDCAAVYLNEGGVGKAIKQAISEGIVKREDLYIVSKLWNTCHAPDKVQPSIENTLKLLELDYIDLYLVHFPIAFEYHGLIGQNCPNSTIIPVNKEAKKPVLAKNAPLHKLWAAMESLVEKGYTKSIGVSNYTIPLVLDMLSYAKILPAVNQIELHPYFSRSDLARLCQYLGIQVMAYSSLGSGYESNETLLKNKHINEIAKAHNSTPAHVLLAWALQNNYVVIPKSSKESRIRENRDWDIHLSEDEMKIINSLDKSAKPLIDTSAAWSIDINMSTL